MIRLPDVDLAVSAKGSLRRWQKDLDAIPSYPRRVALAKTRWKSRNTTRSATFGRIREALARMCSGARRCAYCEDSFADEVEHVRPKDLYPEATFVWENYVYACGPCNGPKNSRFAVLPPGVSGIVDVTRGRNDPVTPPREGEPALIDPRTEDPLAFIELDLVDTFLVLPRPELGARSRARADYTIKVLRLNERDALPVARREAFESYRARMAEYIGRRDGGESAASLAALSTAVQRMQHPFVWAEMKRQRTVHAELARLFGQAPEALAW